MFETVAQACGCPDSIEGLVGIRDPTLLLQDTPAPAEEEPAATEEEPAATEEEPAATEEEGSNSTLLIAGGIGALALIGGAIYLKKSKSSDE